MRFIYMLCFLFISLFCNLISYAQIISFKDPFKLYTPGFYECWTQNDKYQDWFINNTMMGVHGSSSKGENGDSIFSIKSGIKGLELAFNFHAQLGLPLPPKSEKIKILFRYNFKQLFGKDSTLNFVVQFCNKTTIVKTEETVLDPIDPTNAKQNILLEKELKYEIPKGANNCIVKVFTSFGELTLNEMRIFVDGKEIQEYNYDQSLPFSKRDIKRIESGISDTLQVAKTPRIFGIGESVHGSNTLISNMVETVKKRIEKQQCDVLFLEACPFIGYEFDEYVHGKRNDFGLIDSIDKNGYNGTEFKGLLEYIKKVNIDNNKDISVYGFEFWAGLKSDSMMSIILGQCKVRWSETDEFKLLSNVDNIDIYKNADLEKYLDVITLLKNKALQKNLIYDAYLFNYLREFLYHNQTPLKAFYAQRHRDSLMANNFLYYLNNTSNNNIIANGHLGHLARNAHKREMGGSFCPSFGFFVGSKYQDEYFVLGQYVGYGEVDIYRYKGFETKPIQGIYNLYAPIGGSIEQVCNSFNRSDFYINNISQIEELNKITYERQMGRYWQQMQFEPVDLRKELDAIWFTKESVPLK